MSEFFCVALSCVGRGLETGRTLVQGVPTKCLNGFTFAEAKSQRAKCRQQLQQHIPFLLFHTKFRGIKTVSNNAIWFHGRFFSVFMKHPVQSREWCALILLTPLDFKHPIKARSWAQSVLMCTRCRLGLAGFRCERSGQFALLRITGFYNTAPSE